MANKQNSDYDIMKKLLGNIKDMAAHYKKINEDMNTPTLTPDEMLDEQDRFKQAIGGTTVEFGQFIINNERNNVEWSGTFPSIKLAWNFSLDSNKGCYISADMTQLSDENVILIQKLKAYYNEWVTYWANEIS